MCATAVKQESYARLPGLCLTTLGVVYGDIGTSPLYALRECFRGEGSVGYSPGNILGVLSLIFWTLIIVISIKYLIFVMRAENRGEGGIIALVALLNPRRAKPGTMRYLLILMGLFGASLLYGDGTITPAISVLSAIEGLETVTPVFTPFVVPITVGILLGLFLIQSRGTAAIGAVFGPVMLFWFILLAVLGVGGVVRDPAVLYAVNPSYALAFFEANGLAGFLVLGTVFLVATGGEALYADMGHVGRLPIRLSWFGLVLPALLLNYFGQGALVLHNPVMLQHPFYHLAPDWARYPLVAIATAATIIASQAVISGAFSLTRQAVQLGLLPRLNIIHTHDEEQGQIYIPLVNTLLMIATIGLVLGFRSSSNLASAYGVAVSMDMAVTTLLAGVVAHRWGWHPLLLALLGAVFIPVDWAFIGANLFKIIDGGWYPLVVAGALFTLFSTWRRGRELLLRHLQADRIPLDALVYQLVHHSPHRVPGTAVFMTANSDAVPPTLWHHLKFNQVLHEQVMILTVETAAVPRVPTSDRLRIEYLRGGLIRVVAQYGFMQSPNVPVLLRLCAGAGVEIDLYRTVYYLGRETIIPSASVPGMWLWRERLFAFLARNASRTAAFFKIPPGQVVEVGLQVQI